VGKKLIRGGGDKKGGFNGEGNFLVTKKEYSREKADDFLTRPGFIWGVPGTERDRFTGIRSQLP